MDFIATLAATVAENAPAGFETTIFLSFVGIIIYAPVVVLFIAAKLIGR